MVGQLPKKCRIKRSKEVELQSFTSEVVIWRRKCIICLYNYIYISLKSCQTKSGSGILWSHIRFILSWISSQQLDLENFKGLWIHKVFRTDLLRDWQRAPTLPVQHEPKEVNGSFRPFFRHHIWVYGNTVYCLNFSEFSLELGNWILSQMIKFWSVYCILVYSLEAILQGTSNRSSKRQLLDSTPPFGRWA